MAYDTVTFVQGEVPTHIKLNQLQDNITEVRRLHKGGSPPNLPESGMLWLDDSSTPWRLKIYNGTIWDHLLTVTGARGRRNLCINGGFDIWQRNTIFSIGSNGTAYTADQWRAVSGASAVNTVSRQSHALGQVSVPGEPQYFLRMSRTTTGTTSSHITNIIEGARNLAGGYASLLFWAKASANAQINLQLLQVFGTGGSPSVTVTTTIATPQLTTSWQRFAYVFTVPSISGKTMGTNGDDYIGLRFELPTAAGVVSMDISNVQLEDGNINSDFEKLSIEEHRQICQRYYYTSFSPGVVPGANQGVSTALRTVASNTGRFVFGIFPPTTMFRDPVITTWNPGASGSAARNLNDDTSTAVLTTVAKPYFAAIEANGVSATDANDVLALQVELVASIA